MKKIITLLVLLGIVAACAPEPAIPRGVGSPKVPYVVCLEETSDIFADTGYLVIDLSDSTNWPHTNTNEIIIKNVRWCGAVSGAHEWHAHLGVITENDGTDGSATFIHDQILVSLSGMFDSDHVWVEHGLNLRVSSGALTYVGSSITDDDDGTWATDNAITATIGVTGFVAAGDLVLLMDEETDGSTVDFAICVEYDTE